VYEITFASPGFESQVQTGVTLNSGQALRLDASLQLSTLKSEVTISSAATMVNTTNQTLSALIDDRRVQDLPLNGRNVMGLAGILPGVTNVAAPQELSNSRGGPTMIVNGSRAEDNNFTFNGANFTNFGQSTGMNYPPPDAVQEVRIQTQNFTSEYGNSAGSQVSVISKSGSNGLHGAAWEFLRNTDLNARSFFQPQRLATHENQAGGSLGGPLKKDKLFFFGYYQKLWNRPQSGSTVALVPTSAERNGDFRALNTKLKNPNNPLTGRPMTDSSGRPCVAGNIISPGCLSPAAENVLNRFVPQSANGRFVSQIPTPSDNYSFMGRFDYLQSAKHTLNGHFYKDTYNQTFANGTIQPYENGARYTGTQDYAITSTYTFSPRLLNQLTVDYMHAVSHDTPINQYLPSSLGIALPNMDGEGITLTVRGYFNLATADPSLQDYRNSHLRDDMTLIHGRHTLKWGYEGYRVSFTLNTRGQVRAATFSGVGTGDALADYTLGVFDSFTQNFGNSTSNPIGWKHFFYLQDEFKVSPRLTLTFGARYEPYFAWGQKYGKYTYTDIGNFNTVSTVHPDALPGLRFVGDPGTPGNGKLGYNDMNNVGPRAGFAWDVFGDGKTSVRGGYGIFFDQLSINVTHQPEAPFAGTSLLNQGMLDNPYGSLNRPLPPQGTELPGNFGCVHVSQFPGLQCAFPIPANLVSTDPRLVTPYTQSISLTIERQLTKDLAVQASYIGKLSQKLEGHRFWNAAVFKPDPVTGAPASAQNVNNRVAYPQTIGLYNTQSRLLGNDYRANYQGVQLQVNKRFSHGFSLLGSYVFSKEVDNVVNLNPGLGLGTLGLSAGESDPFNLKLDKGRGSFDHTHVFTMSWLWTQQHKFDNPLVNGLLENWSVSAIHTIETGAPIEFNMGSDVALNGTGQPNLEHAQLQPGITYPDVAIAHPDRNAYVNQYFNTSAFVPISQLPKGIYGNAGRNFMDGPGFNNTDFTLTRDFAIGERLRTQLRGEFFNAFNQVHFDPPNTSVASGSFGRILSAQPGRVIQVAIKIIW
jgi:hypothetical protein